MSSSTILHAAFFAVGALVGGGVATAVSNKRSLPVVTPATKSGTSAPPPIVELAPTTGLTHIATPGALVKVDSTVLKHGHPGPINDLLVRKAYASGYDRRLRHPSWVSRTL